MNSELFKIDINNAIEVSGEIIIRNLFVLDGGRTSIYCENNGRFFWIRLVTNSVTDEPFEDGYWPGGLYMNDRLIDINSKEEESILGFLRKIKTPKNCYESSFIMDGELTNHGLLNEKHIQFLINFLESNEYQKLGVKTGRMKD